ncbi:MAG: DUF4136 domain-containing protein [Bacteroidetes bacterium]|nr:DUF4136 domain-containing protein [Bacteroidota bacterium]
MKTKLGFLFLGTGLIFTLSCTKYPPESDRLLEDLVVITQYDTKVDFNNYKTYSIAGSIMEITDKDTVAMTGQTPTAILTQIDVDMQARGFSKVPASSHPEFAIQVLYYQNTNVYTYYYDWWGWGGYYPYYPYSPVYTTSYTTGMLNIELLDLKTADVNQRTYVRWNAFIRGILTGTHTTAEVTGRVNQAFVQTPQLKTTKP